MREAAGRSVGSGAPALAGPLVIAALEVPPKRRRSTSGTIHHSDRGSQYTDARLLEPHAATGMVRSLNRAGNCPGNAMVESFWSTS